jgi:hypothetical protein
MFVHPTLADFEQRRDVSNCQEFVELTDSDIDVGVRSGSE